VRPPLSPLSPHPPSAGAVAPRLPPQLVQPSQLAPCPSPEGVPLPLDRRRQAPPLSRWLTRPLPGVGPLPGAAFGPVCESAGGSQHDYQCSAAAADGVVPGAGELGPRARVTFLLPTDEAWRTTVRPQVLGLMQTSLYANYTMMLLHSMDFVEYSTLSTCGPVLPLGQLIQLGAPAGVLCLEQIRVLLENRSRRHS